MLVTRALRRVVVAGPRRTDDKQAVPNVRRAADGQFLEVKEGLLSAERRAAARAASAALASDKSSYLIVKASGADAGFGVATETGVPEHSEPVVYRVPEKPLNVPGPVPPPGSAEEAIPLLMFM